MSAEDKYVPLEIVPTEDEARLRIRWKDGVASLLFLFRFRFFK